MTAHPRNAPGSPPSNARNEDDAQMSADGTTHDIEGRWNTRRSLLQPAPLLFTQDHHPLWLGDLYRGRSVFLIAGGPSFVALDHSLLWQPGALTMGLNNSVKTFRPQLWVCVDEPDQFIRSIWLDPAIMKFVPLGHAAKQVFNSDEWKFTDWRVGDCPNVVYFKRNEHFQAQQFLWEDCINWGNHKDHGGGRSVMLAALRILFILGLRRVYLLGVDFTMNEHSKYHFEQDRSRASIAGNNATYQKLSRWLGELRPLFEEQDFQVFNCNPNSNLEVFDILPYEEAVRRVRHEFGDIDVRCERTKGLYETSTKEKQAGVEK